ncbi:MAG: tetratricopeptide repeat protein, partial [Candidatus Sulfotelmatobacter sp.]
MSRLIKQNAFLANGMSPLNAAARLCFLLICCTLLFSGSSFGVDAWAKYRFTESAFAQEVNLAGGGNVAAQLSVAKAYYAGTTGTSDARNYSAAVSYFQTASNNGSAEAKAWLGTLYLHGQGVVKSTATALSLIQASASANNPVGLRFLGLMYEGGQGVTQSFATAASYFSQATALN